MSAGPARWWRVGLGVAGVLAIGFGLRGVLLGGVATDWPVTLAWLVAGPLLHDLVVFPAVAAVGWVVARTVPASVRPVVHGGLLVAAAVTAVAIPVLTGRGDPRNPSLTPLDYPRNYALVLAGIAVVTALLAVRRHRRVSRVSRSGGG